MAFTDAEIAEFRDYAQSVVSEYYPLIKRAVSPHAATYMKKDMLRQIQWGLCEQMGLEENKSFFLILTQMHCDVAILAQIRFSNKTFRATLTKEIILEKCRMCNLDEQSIRHTLKVAGFN